MELAILRFINEHLHSVPFFTEFFKAVTYFGEHGIFAVGVCAALLIFKKPRSAGAYALSALAIEYAAANLLLKPLVDRTRPFALDGSIAEFLTSVGCPIPSDASFPSGHTGIMFALAFALYFHFGRALAPVFILSSAVALSRIYLCVHYPTDVLGGVLIGYISAALARFLPVYKKDGGALPPFSSLLS